MNTSGATFTHVPFLPEWVNELPLPLLVCGLWIGIPTLAILLNVLYQLVRVVPCSDRACI